MYTPRKSRSKEDIIEILEDVCLERSLNKLTMDDIAAKNDVNRETIYNWMSKMHYIDENGEKQQYKKKYKEAIKTAQGLNDRNIIVLAKKGLKNILATGTEEVRHETTYKYTYDKNGKIANKKISSEKEIITKSENDVATIKYILSALEFDVEKNKTELELQLGMKIINYALRYDPASASVIQRLIQEYLFSNKDQAKKELPAITDAIVIPNEDSK